MKGLGFRGFRVWGVEGLGGLGFRGFRMYGRRAWGCRGAGV